jgi:hypothetical protein
MSDIAYARIESLLDELNQDEQLRLLEVVAGRLRGDKPPPAGSLSLKGLWKDGVPPDFDLDEALREIRSGWSREEDDKSE